MPSLFEEQQSRWIREGIERGFCTVACCAVHDFPPLTKEEEAKANESIDNICIGMVRLTESTVHAIAIQDNNQALYNEAKISVR